MVTGIFHISTMETIPKIEFYRKKSVATRLVEERYGYNT